MDMNFYKLLNLSLAKQKGTLTDQLVEKNYSNIRQQYTQMMQKCANDKENVKKLEEHLKMLEEAYNAIKTENDRKQYDEYLANAEKESKNKNEETLSASRDNNEISNTQVNNAPVNDINNNLNNINNPQNTTVNNSVETQKEEIDCIEVVEGGIIYHGRYIPRKSVEETQKVTRITDYPNTKQNEDRDDHDDMDI